MGRTFRILAAVAALQLAAFSAAAIPVGDVPNPKETASSFVQDSAGVLGPEYSAMIDAVSGELEQKTSAELAVVTVDDLDGTTVEDYAERLFGRFGIGKRGKDNGVLILFSLGDRKVRIEVGYGLEGVINDARAGRMLDEKALPSFREGQYGKGLFMAALAVAGEIARAEGAEISTGEPAQWPEQVAPPKPAASGEEVPAAQARSLVRWLTAYFIFMLAATSVSIVFTYARVRSKRARAARREALGSGVFLPIILWFVGGVSIYVIGAISKGVLLPIVVFLATSIGFTSAYFAFRKSMKKRIERYALPCPSCGRPMQLVDDITDNRYLEEEEVAEERAGGMEYEFWLCEPCDKTERLEVVLHKAEPCPKCERRTLKRRTEILRIATTTEEGKERIHYECHNPACGYKRSEDRRIPKKSSTRSGGLSGSSSSGSSFGGGSSGGGGSSRGW